MDKSEAITWFQKAAEGGIPAACLYLGIKYEFGNTVEQNIFQAIKWYKKAAFQDWPDAQFHLGRVFLEGGNDVIDYVQSYAWLGLAEEADYPGAGETKEKVKALLSAHDISRAEELQAKLRLQILRTSK